MNLWGIIAGMKRLSGNIYTPEGDFRQGDVHIEDGLIRDVRYTGESLTCEEALDSGEALILPGLVDIHTHGCIGYDTCTASSGEIYRMAEYERSRGITSFCPTTMTLPEDVLEEICVRVSEVKHSAIKGIYLEGPFISKEKKGAQNPQYIIPPDSELIDRLLAASGGLIRFIAIAPETEGAIELIRNRSKSLCFTIAHTMADYDTAIAAIEAGIKQVTHLYNAMPSYNHRAPGVVGAAYDSDVCAELICDGTHLHPAVIRSTYKIMGAERIILISDSMEATGMPDGEYELGGQRVIKRGSRATLTDGTLAGSVSDLYDCLRFAILAGIRAEDAIYSATATPAKALGMYDRIGSIESGKAADILILNDKLDISEVFSA